MTGAAARSGLLAAGIALAFLGLVRPVSADPPNDPYFRSRHSWAQDYDDQWALKHVGFDGPTPAWDLVGPDAKPVIVAIIDTGLDWNHVDLPRAHLWKNPKEIAGNGRDDDKNGYVDDVIGWDFFEDDNKPWDNDGHGTFVAGVIGAATGNRLGIAGINPNARLMIVKAVNDFGHSRLSYIAQGIVYAVDNGARIINISIGGPEGSEVEKAALDYAAVHNVLVVVAAGNEGQELKSNSFVGSKGVIMVAASTPTDSRATFSNWGRSIDLVAPGVDILSLRARRTDTILFAGVDYVAGSAYVGGDRRYYRASGTSFSAPIVTGIASLLLSKNPNLTAEQVKRILINSARDIETPGYDNLSGWGLVDARAALRADPATDLEAYIDSVGLVQVSGGYAVQVKGTATADKFKTAYIELGSGKTPASWTRIGDALGTAVVDGVVGSIPQSKLGKGVWTIRLVVVHQDGHEREARYDLTIN
jgi:subtilisin family serine protease